jgi:hypothetical protein
MAFKRKAPDKDTLIVLMDEGKTVRQIADAFGVDKATIRRHQTVHGLVVAKTQAYLLEQARNRPAPPAGPKKNDVRLTPDRITFTRDIFMDRHGFELRDISLPRNSMHLAAIAKRYPQISGGTNAGL